MDIDALKKRVQEIRPQGDMPEEPILQIEGEDEVKLAFQGDDVLVMDREERNIRCYTWDQLAAPEASGERIFLDPAGQVTSDAIDASSRAADLALIESALMMAQRR
jgi:hypothetical protein